MEDAIGRIVQERLGSTNTTSHRFVKDFNDMKRSVARDLSGSGVDDRAQSEQR